MKARGWAAVGVLSISVLGGSTRCGSDWPRWAAEAVLRTDLKTMRDCLRQYLGDKGVCAESLDELVRAGYLHKLPVDPITRSADSWVVVLGDDAGVESCRGRIADVRSGSDRFGLDGRPYSEW